MSDKRTVGDVAKACETVVNDSPVDCQSRRGTEHRSVRPVPTKKTMFSQNSDIIDINIITYISRNFLNFLKIIAILRHFLKKAVF